ncbi:hypothetical protein CAter10_3016 [Collimonas arenae]|nr:hypothetical protein CAter10_3016 [Collimonas arenae]
MHRWRPKCAIQFGITGVKTKRFCVLNVMSPDSEGFVYAV